MSHPNVEINLDDVTKEMVKNPIWAVRGQSIQAYANLEQSLCSLFAHCGEIQNPVAGIIFFRITSTQVRNQILDKLIRRKFGGEFNLFWNSYIKDLRPIDIKRNEIVHWNLVTHINVDSGSVPQVSGTLMPPNFWIADENTPSLAIEDLLEFMTRCDFYARAANMFIIMTKGLLTGVSAQTWPDIFRQQLAYPPPDTHPLSRNYKEPDSPPLPSQS